MISDITIISIFRGYAYLHHCRAQSIRFYTAPDKLKAATELFTKCLIDPQDPLRENQNNTVVLDRKKLLNTLTDKYTRAQSDADRQNILESFANTISNAVLTDLGNFKIQIYNTLGSTVKPPATFASVVMKTLFNGHDAVNKMMKSLDGVEKTSLFASMMTAGSKDLHMNSWFFPNPNDVADELQKKAEQATALSLDMEIGF